MTALKIILKEENKMSVKTLLEKEIESQLTTLDDLNFGTDEYEKAVNGLAKLLDKYNEMEHAEMEYQDKYESREAENDLKLKQMDEDRKDRIVKNCLTAVSAVSGIGLAVWGTLKTLKFEETGTITTMAGRTWINKLFPKK